MENYEMIRVIGEGSFGKVYLMRHKNLRKMVCVKVIKIRNIPKKEREACKAEVELLKRLKHPNIVSYIDNFLSSSRESLCIVMEFADGGDLASQISKAKGQTLPESKVLHWFVQMCLGLHYMHEKRVLHRDLKTQNIFLLGNGRLVLGDLGISKVLDGTMDFAQTCIGTPYYMSPEIFKNKPYNHKSDIWALGCVLYEMATLKHAFNANSLNGLAVKIIKGKYLPVPSKYSTHLKELIEQMLDINPQRRPDLENILKKPFITKHIGYFLSDIVQRPQNNIGEGTMIVRAAAVNILANERGAASPYTNNHLQNADVAALTNQLVTLQLQNLIARAIAPPPVSNVVEAEPAKAQKVVREQQSALRREEERKRQVEEALQRLRDERNQRMAARQKALEERAKGNGIAGRPRGMPSTPSEQQRPRQGGAMPVNDRGGVKKPVAARNSRPQAREPVQYAEPESARQREKGVAGAGIGNANGVAAGGPQRAGQKIPIPRKKDSVFRARDRSEAEPKGPTPDLDRYEDYASARSERSKEAQRIAEEAIKKREQSAREAKVKEDQERREILRQRERARQKEEMERLRQDKLELDRREKEMVQLREKRREAEQQKLAEERRLREKKAEEDMYFFENKPSASDAISQKDKVLQRKLQRQKDEEEKRLNDLRRADLLYQQQRVEALKKQKAQYMNEAERSKEEERTRIASLVEPDTAVESAVLPPLHRDSPVANMMVNASKKVHSSHEDDPMAAKFEEATKGLKSRYVSDRNEVSDRSDVQSQRSLPEIADPGPRFSNAAVDSDEAPSARDSDDDGSESDGWATPDIEKEEELEDMKERERELQEELMAATTRCETIKKTIIEAKSFILKKTGGEGSPVIQPKKNIANRFPCIPLVEPLSEETSEDDGEDEDSDQETTIHGVKQAIIEESYSEDEFESELDYRPKPTPKKPPRVIPEFRVNDLINEAKGGADDDYYLKAHAPAVVPKFRVNDLISEAKGGAEEDYYPSKGGNAHPSSDWASNSPDGRLKERVRALKQRCIDGLGSVAFQRAYTYLKMVQHEQDNKHDTYDLGHDEEERVTTALTEIMGRDKLHYWGLIDQLIFMEDTHLS